MDVYGYGSQVITVRPPLLYKGQVNYKDVPALLARYETFLFLPIEAEPYNRATVEAYAAGCELVVNRNVGPLWWIENDPKSMEDAHNLMWRAIEGAIAGIRSPERPGGRTPAAAPARTGAGGR